MDLSSIKVSADEVEDELRRLKNAAEAAGAFEDACSVYRKVRPVLEVAVAILSALYPPGAAAVATVKIILDKACDQG